MAAPFRSSCLILLIFHLFSLTQCLQFNYNPFGSPFAGLFTVEGDAFSGASSVDLTAVNSANLSNSVGRILNNDALLLWNRTTGQEASFNTTFEFHISALATNGVYGDGLAFFLLANSSSEIPINSFGGSLALFNATNNGSTSNQIVAVEFDTFFNWFDPDANHVGIDVNGIISVSTASLDFDLKTASSVYAWIDYQSETHTLNVYAANQTSKPGQPLLSQPLNLSRYLPETVRVGFSGATGANPERHTLFSWTFSSTNLTFNDSENLPLNGSPSSTISTSTGQSKVGLIAGVSILSVVVVATVAGCVIWKKRSTRQQLPNRNNEIGIFLGELHLDSSTYGPRKFTYKQLSIATKNFSDKELLGKGGFGPVYKGILPGDETPVAVKSVSQNSMQGVKEFIAEVTIISRSRHRHLVQLQGWCHERGKLLLVYEYMPNGSLDQFLFTKQADVLDWSRRFGIVCGLGAALQYLHEECEQVVIHRDVKSSNVLLDAKFTAKLGDFGLARRVEHGIAAHTTIVAGTVGYMAPECYGTGKATTESDVFSFGAVLLEVACGRRPSDSNLPSKYEGRLVDWVWDLHGQDKLLEAADGRMEGCFDPDEMARVLVIGLACSHPDPKSRPTIRGALASLHGKASLPVLPPSKPVASYGPLPPKSIEEVLLSETYGSSVYTSSSDNTQASSSVYTSSSNNTETAEKPLLL